MSIASPFDTSRSTVGIAATALLFVVLAALLDGPIWLVKLVPTQDGPVHLAQADLIARFGWGGTLEGPAATFYQWNSRIEPNSAIYLLLAGLIRLTGDALIANSLFLTLYGLLWIAAAFAVSRAETERPLLPILLLLPLAFGVFIHWGFYNFSLGVPMFLLFASYWRSVGGRRNAITFVTTALFLAALYLTHITSVVAACLLLAADGIARAIQTLRPFRPPRRRQTACDRWRLGGRGRIADPAADRQLPDGVPEYSGRSAGHGGRRHADPAPDLCRHLSLHLHLVGSRRAGAVARRAWDRSCRGVAADQVRRSAVAGLLRARRAAVAFQSQDRFGPAVGTPRPLQRHCHDHGDCEPSTGCSTGAHALHGGAGRPDRPDRHSRPRLQELGADAGKRTRSRPRQSGQGPSPMPT